MIVFLLAGMQPAFAGPYDGAMKNAKYVVMSGDVNGDGQNDVLLKAVPSILMIPFDDMLLPVQQPSRSPTFALVSVSFGNYTLVVNPSEATIASAAWKPAAQQLVLSGADGVYADTITIAPASDFQAGFKVGITGTGDLVLVSTTPPVLDPTVPQPSPAYPMSSYMAGAQDFATCTKAYNGDRLMLWTTGNADRISMLKRTDADGRVLGRDEHMVLGTGVVSIAANKVGNFIVLRTVPNGSYTDLVAVVYSRAGDIMARMQVNPLNLKMLRPNGFATLYEDGSFAVAFQTTGTMEPQKLWFNRFGADGVPINQFYHDIGSTFTLTGLASDQRQNGLTVMTYTKAESDGNGGSRWDTYQVRSVWPTNLFAAPVRVNLYQGRAQFSGDVAVNPKGNYAISWSSLNQDGPGLSIYTQLYDVSGARMAPPLKVSTELSSMHSITKLSLFDNDTYALTWGETVNGVTALKTRAVDGPNNTLVGKEISVAPILEGRPLSACSDPSGSYSVAWRHDHTFVNGGFSADVMIRDFPAQTMPSFQPVKNGQLITNLSAAKGTWKYYRITVPANTTALRVTTSSDTVRVVGDADLFLRYAGLPANGVFDISSATPGVDEGVQAGTPPPGAFYIGIYATEAYESLSLRVNYE